MARDGGSAGEFEVAVGNYILSCVPDGLPFLFNEYTKHAKRVDQFALDQRSLCCIAVSRNNEKWPFLVVAQSFSPAGSGFEPGALIIPSTDRLFVGAGERVLAYDLSIPQRLWLDSANVGFWGWAQHNEVVVMSGELELAAWSASGEKLWTTYVEPPWDYEVREETVYLEIMGEMRSFPIRLGPPYPRKEG